MVLDKDKLISNLELLKHPEGGYYKQTYKSPININGRFIGLDRGEYRSLASSIYFLLNDTDVSHLHRLKSDEIWYYHAGESLNIVIINNNGNLEEKKLGLDIENGELPQVLVPAGSIFGSYIQGGKGVSLVGCMVSYSFDFIDFELFPREELVNKYPEHIKIIEKLTY